MSDVRHYDEELQDLIDGRLSADDERQVRVHLSTCRRCQAALEQLEIGRAATASLRRSVSLPPGLASSIAVALDDEDGRRAPVATPVATASTPRWSPAWRWATAASIALAILAGAIFWTRPLSLPAQAARDFTSVATGDTPLEIRSAIAAEVEGHFARTLEPRIRVIDLAMMGFTLEGGRRHTLGSRPSALYVYRSATGDRIVCQMFPGSAVDLPPSTDVRENAGFRFHVLRQGDIALVFWLEGDIVCVLASPMPTEALVKLAFEKAMRPI